ncbi:diadenosine tetraphosphate hydrolase [Lactobacillus delbrueckii subsp. bulgaricus]|nr:diadenosine tetraphosphate hydrolase [Lactobacillus delbrueckii subsp. bulgaricus]MBT9076071.1 diadenosine tetraphosphate hydrolase [Lactobacillus delbrueckii subsp. bulgaricus]MBT9077771.1 diadenosine tetraphosphate hydrolase [Lactobacillus delbrueckii subsp. bulgaricus]
MTKAELIDDCLFCKIIRGEIPSYTVFENDDVKAFLDISQVNEGHVLMVPKKHLTNSFDYSAEDASRFMQYVPEIAKAIKASDPRIQAMNITSNNGEIAGQVVMHSHIHFIPRWEGDGIKFFTRNNADQYDEKKYQEVCDRIKAQF